MKALSAVLLPALLLLGSVSKASAQETQAEKTEKAEAPKSSQLRCRVRSPKKNSARCWRRWA